MGHKSDSLRLNNCVVGTKLSCHGKSAQISGHLFEARSVKWAIDLHQSYWQSHGILTLGRRSNLSSKKCTGNIVSTRICDVSQWQTKKCCVCGKIGIVLQFQTKVYVDLYFRNFAAYYWRFQSVTVTLSTPFTCYRQFPALVMFYSPAFLVREYRQLKLW